MDLSTNLPDEALEPCWANNGSLYFPCSLEYDARTGGADARMTLGRRCTLFAFGVVIAATFFRLAGEPSPPARPQAPFDAIANAAVRTNVLIIGELHGLTDGLEGRVLASVAQTLGSGARVFAHEALYEEWQPWLDAVNTSGYDSSHLEEELLEQSKLTRRTAGAEQAYRSAARACLAALKSGYRIEALDSGPSERQAREVREERLLRRLRVLRRRTPNALLVAVVGEAHAEPDSILVAQWDGKPPVVLLTWEPFRDRPPAGTIALGPLTFFHTATR